MSLPPASETTDSIGLQRHLGLLQATALNVSMIVGAGVFITIPLMLLHLPGPYALLGWLVAGLLMIMDGLIWSELGAMLPGSGGSYRYLLEAYGPKRWGRLMAFLFIWQFLISGPPGGGWRRRTVRSARAAGPREENGLDAVVELEGIGGHAAQGVGDAGQLIDGPAGFISSFPRGPS